MNRARRRIGYCLSVNPWVRESVSCPTSPANRHVSRELSNYMHTFRFYDCCKCTFVTNVARTWCSQSIVFARHCWPLGPFIRSGHETYSLASLIDCSCIQQETVSIQSISEYQEIVGKWDIQWNGCPLGDTWNTVWSTDSARVFSLCWGRDNKKSNLLAA